MPTHRTDITVSPSPAFYSLKLPDGREGRLLALGVTFIFVLLAWLLISSLLDLYRDGAATIDSRHLVLEHTEALVDTIPALQAKYEEATHNAPGSALLISETSDETAVARLQESVHDVADSVHVELSSQEPLPIVRSGTFERLGVRISLTAYWPDLIRLLSVFSESTAPRLLADDLQVQVAGSSRIEDEAKKGRMIDATLTIFALRDAPAKHAARSVTASSTPSSR